MVIVHFLSNDFDFCHHQSNVHVVYVHGKWMDILLCIWVDEIEKGSWIKNDNSNPYLISRLFSVPNVPMSNVHCELSNLPKAHHPALCVFRI